MVETQVFIESIMAELKNQLKTVNKMLEDSPQGRVICVKNNGRPAIMQVVGKGSGRKRRIITKDKNLQVALARRGVMEREQMIISKSLDILGTAAEKLARITDRDRKAFMAERYGWMTEEMTERVFSPELPAAWADAPYERSEYHASAKKMLTSRGLAVRSKSELMIAEMLYRYGIPFRYEPVIRVNDKLVLNPDFMILCPDGTLIVWEHEGLVSSASYIEWQRKKAEYYAILGFVPWKNYIVTYDTEDGDLDLRIIDSEIRNKILNGHGW